MKAITIVKKIEKENACSIHTAELLTDALHREGRLPNGYAIRFRPLFGDFDVVNADFEKHRVTYSVGITLEELKNIAM